MKKIVLLSGGLDSTVCLAMSKRSLIAEPMALFVEWGQPNLKKSALPYRRSLQDTPLNLRRSVWMVVFGTKEANRCRRTMCQAET